MAASAVAGSGILRCCHHHLTHPLSVGCCCSLRFFQSAVVLETLKEKPSSCGGGVCGARTSEPRTNGPFPIGLIFIFNQVSKILILPHSNLVLGIPRRSIRGEKEEGFVLKSAVQYLNPSRTTAPKSQRRRRRRHTCARRSKERPKYVQPDYEVVEDVLSS